MTPVVAFNASIQTSGTVLALGRQDRLIRRSLFFELLDTRQEDEKTDAEWMYALDTEEDSHPDALVTKAAMLHARGDHEAPLALLSSVIANLGVVVSGSTTLMGSSTLSSSSGYTAFAGSRPQGTADGGADDAVATTVGPSSMTTIATDRPHQDVDERRSTQSEPVTEVGATTDDRGERRKEGGGGGGEPYQCKDVKKGDAFARGALRYLLTIAHAAASRRSVSGEEDATTNRTATTRTVVAVSTRN